MSEIIYRIIDEDDYEALQKLWLSQEQTRRALNPIDDSKEGISRYLQRNPLSCFGAFDGAELIGAILAGHDGRRGIIHHLCVREDYKRQKIASTLVNKAEESLRNEGIQKIFCVVFTDNEQANAFWQSRGYSRRNNINYRNKSLNEKIPTGE